MKLIFKIWLLTLFSNFCISENDSDEEIVDKINSLNATWTAKKYNETGTIMFVEEELLPTPESRKDNCYLKEYKDLPPPPESFDARKQWPNCKSIGTIGNQKNCGSCWAYSTVTAITDRQCICSGNNTFIGSIETMLSCCKDCSFIHGCLGGRVDKSWQYWVNEGISSEECKPYKGSFLFSFRCKKSCKTSNLNWNDDLVKGKECYKFKSIKDVQHEIMENGPIVFAFTVYNDFFNYASGIYKKSWFSFFAGKHAVKVVGWGVENKVPYWILANSCGTSWGEDGFFRILRGSNQCNIEDTAHMYAASCK